MHLDIALDWQGPYRWGGGPKQTLPPDDVAGVYMAVVPTPEHGIVNYVGESTNLRSRIAQHVSNALGGYYEICQPEKFFRGEAAERIYRDDGKDARLLELRPYVVQAAIDNLACTEWFWATTPPDPSKHRNFRMAIEAALLDAVVKSGHSQLLTTKVSVRPENAYAVRLCSAWPDGVAIAGIGPQIEYGEHPVGEELLK